LGSFCQNLSRGTNGEQSVCQQCLNSRYIGELLVLAWRFAGGNRDFTWGGETNSVLAGQVTWFRDTDNNRTIIQVDDADADLTTDGGGRSSCTPCSSPTSLL
jgi:hypothetical protein